MDSCPLNAAHHQHRRAEVSMRQGRYNDAIQRHLRAADLLEQALKFTSSPIAAESIKLQSQFHLRQKGLIKSLQEQHESLKKAVERQEMNAPKLCNANMAREIVPNCLKIKVNSIMDDADSLVDLLVRKYQDDSNKEPESEIDMKQLSIIETVYKDPKNDKMVMEELKTVNHQLREVIMQLLSQLDASEHENRNLKRRIAFLECGANDGIEIEPSPQSSPQNHRHSPLAIITDSGEDESPFIYSPGSDLSPEVGEMRELPPLAPLEMPEFNYEMMMKQLRMKREENERMKEEALKKA
ncbi:nuclear receptor-binding factor 2-like isoform X2 [Arctopsyche grandis]|uniref:nuclear receptor-binding factor 2-like isoform X2 n=1 Tax=Arctopsyche grandis TaxID=121162 RepID=UPI00406D7E46